MSTLDSFRGDAHRVVDFIADYLEGLQRTPERYPVLSRANPGDVRALLPSRPPTTGESFDAMLEDVRRIVMPAITHWQHPSFFAYFPANSSPPAILGEMLSAGLGVQGMLWATSPACTELETHMLDWLVEMLDLPRAFLSDAGGGPGTGGGVIQDTASSSVLCALVAARERATGFQSDAHGMAQATTRAAKWRAGPGGTGDAAHSGDDAQIAPGAHGPLVAYTSTQAHSSVEKAMAIAGLGRANLRLVDVDDRFAMRPDALEGSIAADRAAGLVPAFCCATVGTTGSNAIDPVRAIGEICRRHGTWLHVDAAMSGTAALCPEFRSIHDGLEHADSYCFNPHKWMFVNFDCDCFWVRDRATLVRALSVLPEYLRNSATSSGKVIDYRDWQVPLGRRFRALKLWFAIRHFGVEGLRARVREHVAWAQEFAGWVRADDRFELAVDPPLNLVAFRLRGGEGIDRANEMNERLMAAVNASGAMYLTHTKLDGRTTLRMSIGGTWTTREDVVQAWARLRAQAHA
ncbi:MAG: pyridoxal-dependent decarboxylase [Phycisphaerales bacterium]